MNTITGSTGATGLLRKALHPTILLNMIAPFGAYQLLTAYGASELAALSVAAVFPLAAVVTAAVRSGQLELIGMLSVTAIALGLLGGLVLREPRLLLVKDSLVSGMLGLAFVGSLLAARPLSFALARRLNTRDPAELEQRWSNSAAFRARMRRITVVWGVALLSEATLRVVLAFLIPPAALLVISPLLAAAVIGPVAGWTFSQRRRADAGRLSDR